MKIGSLFTGAGGLDMAVEEVLGGHTVWRSDIKPASVSLIEHYWPGTNLGDLTKVDWSAVEPVDVLCGGFPCTDVSLAGKRRGLIRYADNTRTGLWGHMAQAIDVLRPRWVVAENVRGLLSGKADRPMGSSAEPLEEGELRALGAVLGDLAELGYDAQWCGLRASDVGAAHQRFRVFILAHPADAAGIGSSWVGGSGLASEQPAATGHRATAGDPDGVAGQASGERAGGRNEMGHAGALPGAVGPDRMGAGDRGREAAANADGTGLERTRSGAPEQGVGRGRSAHGLGPTDWGRYTPAIDRWAGVIGRTPPGPISVGPRGGRRLAADLTDWLMGWPDGWTAVPGLTNSQRLSLGGDGVVPQQAAAALRHLLNVADVL